MSFHHEGGLSKYCENFRETLLPPLAAVAAGTWSASLITEAATCHRANWTRPGPAHWVEEVTRPRAGDRHTQFVEIRAAQCSAAHCVSIFLGAAACTAPKFYIFTEANMCVYCSVQCAAQRRHQTILMWLQMIHQFSLTLKIFITTAGFVSCDSQRYTYSISWSLRKRCFLWAKNGNNVRSLEIHYLDTITEAGPYFTFLQPLARIQFCGQFLIMISFRHSVHC